jgi:hypothetical protein
MAQRVEDIFFQCLNAQDSEQHVAAAFALAQLDPSLASLDLRGLASHPAAHVRCAAALHWARKPNRPPDLGDVFAADRDRGVRMQLLHGLPSIVMSDAGLAERLRAQLA